MQRSYLWLTLAAFVFCGCGTSNEKEITEQSKNKASSQQVIQKTTSSQSFPKTPNSDPSLKTSQIADQQVLVTEQMTKAKNPLDLSYIPMILSQRFSSIRHEF
jgi:PBP1b-binding outer membrane lipoprotein LpoB